MKEILLNLLALVLTALTPDGGEVPAEMQAEIDTLKEGINALPDAAATAPVEDTAATNALMQSLTNLAENIKNNSTKLTVSNKLIEAKVLVTNTALRSFENKQREITNQSPKVVNRGFNAFVKNGGEMRIFNTPLNEARVLNSNNANFTKSIEEEFSFSQILRQDGFLSGLKVVNLPIGSNQIMWTEGTRGANGTAVFAIGNDRPTKTNTTATVLKATDTLGQQTTVPVQLLRAINGVETLYQDDLKGDLEDKVALQVAAVIATANNPINITVVCKTPNISDVIESAYLQLKPYAAGKAIVIAISSQQQKALNLLKDENGNKLMKLDYPDLQIVNFIATETYTDDTIFGWVSEMSVRFYNDGLQMFSDEVNGIGLSGDNFKKNQISLAVQYLNEALLIRATDVVTTIYDSISGTIDELVGGA